MMKIFKILLYGIYLYKWLYHIRIFFIEIIKKRVVN